MCTRVLHEHARISISAASNGTVAIPSLRDNSMAEDLPLATWGAVADALRTCVAQNVQDLCAHVPHEHGHVSISAASDGTVAGHTYPPGQAT